VPASGKFCPYPISTHVQHYAYKLLLLLLPAAVALSSAGAVRLCVAAAHLAAAKLRQLLCKLRVPGVMPL
jgi:hypothetical protein